MFSKLLKHDFISVGRIWWIAALSVLGISVAGGFGLADIIIHAEDYDYFPIGIFGVMMTYMVFVAFGIITTVLLFIRYFKNFFTDEGYLTFTLPVKRSTLYWSKTVNSFIWQCLTGLVVFLSLFIVFLISPSPEESYLNFAAFLFYTVKDLIASLYLSIGFWLYVYALLILVLIILYYLFSAMLVELCITVGAIIVKRAKVLVAIGLMYGISGVISTVSTLMYFGLPSWSYTLADTYGAVAAKDGALALPALVLAFLCVGSAVLCTIISNVTVGCLERKLNLA